MNGIPNRVVRLVTLVSVAAVSILGSTQAMAAAPINYYQGSANGTALNLSASPDAALQVSLAELQNVINGLPPGLPATVNGVIGSTLQNPTGSINIGVDSVSVDQATAKDGNKLSGGTATSAPLTVDAAALKDEINLVNNALNKLPSGTVAALNQALAPLIANDPTGTIQTTLTALQGVADPVTQLLGSPTIGPISQGLSATFPENKIGQFATVNEGGILTATAPFAQDVYHASAGLASADNALSSVSLAPSLLNNLHVNQTQLNAALTALRTALVSVENTLISTAGGVPAVGSGTTSLLGTVIPVINGTVSTVPTAVGNSTVLTQVNSLINSVSLLQSLLGQLNGLQMNDILGTGPSTAVSSVQKSADGLTVSANGMSQLAHVDAIKLVNPLLIQILSQAGLGNFAGKDLVTVDGIQGNASVTLDGVNVPNGGPSPAREKASGKLANITVLGTSLKDLAGVDLDTFLQPGSTCVINIPGNVTGCPILPPVILPTGNMVPNLLTITITRGAPVYAANPTATSGTANIVTLDVSVALNCGAVSQLVPALPNLPVAISLALCGGGINPAAARTSNAAPAAAANTNQVELVHAQFGRASAALTLASNGQLCAPQPCGGSPLPLTGNNMLILAAFGLMLAAAGIGINRIRVPVRG